MPYRRLAVEHPCKVHRVVAATSACIACNALLCPQCSVGGKCARCRRSEGWRRIALGTAIVAGLVATAGAAVATARSAPPPGAELHAQALAEVRAFAEKHPCDGERLERAMASDRNLPGGRFAPMPKDDLDLRGEILRVHLASTCPPMSASFHETAFGLAMELRDFRAARTIVDRELQGAGATWHAYEHLEALGMATNDRLLVRLAREGFQSIHPTAAYGAALDDHP